jgi:hypothetical protein
MRWEGIPATSVAKYLNIPVLFNITDTFIEEHIDALHVGRYSAVDGIWKGISIKANTDAQLTGFLQDHLAQVLGLQEVEQGQHLV